MTVRLNPHGQRKTEVHYYDHAKYGNLCGNKKGYDSSIAKVTCKTCLKKLNANKNLVRMFVKDNGRFGDGTAIIKFIGEKNFLIMKDGSQHEGDISLEQALSFSGNGWLEIT